MLREVGHRDGEGARARVGSGSALAGGVWARALRLGSNAGPLRVVADLIRVDKGHTEGLEENVVEQIVQLIVAAGR